MTAAAFNRARQLRRPFNTFVTINWSLSPSSDHPVDRWQQWADSARRWLAERGADFTWAYVWERGDGLLQHIHLVMHVPHEMRDDFKVKTTDWVADSSRRREVHKRAVDVEWLWSPDTVKLVRYLIKGSDQATRALYGVGDHLSERQGLVEGKRAAASKDLRDISWPDEGDGRAPNLALAA
jgi:hypothetical protein